MSATLASSRQRFDQIDERSGKAAFCATGVLGQSGESPFFPFSRTRITTDIQAPLELSLASVTFADSRLIRFLDRVFVQRNAPAITSFLSTKPQLVSLLFEIWQKLKEYFPDTQPRLRLVTDDEGAIRILVEIPTTESLEVAMVHLKEFDRDWWLESMAAAKGKIVVDLSLE